MTSKQKYESRISPTNMFYFVDVNNMSIDEFKEYSFLVLLNAINRRYHIFRMIKPETTNFEFILCKN